MYESLSEQSRLYDFFNFFVMETFKHIHSREKSMVKPHVPITQLQQLPTFCHISSIPHFFLKYLKSNPRDHTIPQLKMKVKFAQLCPILCDRMDHTVHGILQARILVWVAFPFSRGSSQSRDWTQVSHIAGGFFTNWATREAQEYWSR